MWSSGITCLFNTIKITSIIPTNIIVCQCDPQVILTIIITSMTAINIITNIIKSHHHKQAAASCAGKFNRQTCACECPLHIFAEQKTRWKSDDPCDSLPPPPSQFAHHLYRPPVILLPRSCWSYNHSVIVLLFLMILITIIILITYIQKSSGHIIVAKVRDYSRCLLGSVHMPV